MGVDALVEDVGVDDRLLLPPGKLLTPLFGVDVNSLSVDVDGKPAELEAAPGDVASARASAATFN